MEQTQQRKKTVSYIINIADHELPGHHSLGVNVVRYDKQSHTLISGGRDGVVSLWRPKKFSEAGSQADGDGSVDKAGFSNSIQDNESDDYTNVNDPDDIKRYIAENVGNDDEVEQLEDEINGESIAQEPVNAADYKMVNTCHRHLDWVNDVKILGATNRDRTELNLATCSNDFSVKIWRTNKEAPVMATVGYHDDYVSCMGFTGQHSHYGTQLVSGGLDNQVKVWDVGRQACLDSFHFPEEKGSVYSVDCFGNYIVTGGPTSVVTLFDRRDMKRPIRHFLGHTDTIRCLKMGSKSFLSCSSDTRVCLWDLRVNRAMRIFDMHNSPVWSLYVPSFANLEGAGSANKAYDSDPSFDVFYTGDKEGLVVKTDLRASDLDPSLVGPQKRGYLNDRVNSNLGISTVVADLSIYKKGKESAGVLGIAGGEGSIWTASAVSKDGYMLNWAVPNTNKLVLYQGIRLYKNLELLSNVNEPDDHSHLNSTPLNRTGTSGAMSITASISNDNSDIVSQFSHDDMNQIDEALSTTFSVDEAVLGFKANALVDGSGLGNAAGMSGRLAGSTDRADGDKDGEIKVQTLLLSLNGGPNTEYVIDEDTEGEEKKLTINTQKVPDHSVELLTFNDHPLQSIDGSNGLVVSRQLNNRRHVATMDQNGCIYVIDIVEGSLVKKIDMKDEKFSRTASDCYEDEDRFEEITDGLQTEESLPQWCSVQTKGGMLFITLKENSFTSCEIYDDEFMDEYADRALGLDKTQQQEKEDDKLSLASSSVASSKPTNRYNLGKVVLKSLFSDFIDEVFTPQQIKIRTTIRAKERSEEEKENKSLHKLSVWKTLSRTKSGVKDKTDGRGSLRSVSTSSVYSMHGLDDKDGKKSTEKKKEKKKTTKKKKKKKKGFFKRYLHRGKQDDEDEDDKAKNEANGSVGQGEEAQTEEEKKKFLEEEYKKQLQKEIMSLSTTKQVLDWMDERSLTGPDGISLADDDDGKKLKTPYFKYDKKMMVTINENIRAYGTDTKTLFLTHIGEQKDVYSSLEKFIPAWVSRAVLLDVYDHIPTRKVEFTVGPDTSGLPELEELKSNKLSAHSLLRIDRVIAYVKGKLPESEKHVDFEILCRGNVLDGKTTLNTVKNRIWKSSGDVKLTYRKKN